LSDACFFPGPPQQRPRMDGRVSRTACAGHKP
jgi:hypothetical protein